jgi:hypothetical protein
MEPLRRQVAAEIDRVDRTTRLRKKAHPMAGVPRFAAVLLTCWSASGCGWLLRPSDLGSRAPAPRPQAAGRDLTAGLSPEAVTSFELGRRLFDARDLEAARPAFERAAADPHLALEARAYLLRIDVLTGRAPGTDWVIDTRRAQEPETAVRIRVEVRWLLEETRTLLAAGRTEEAGLRLQRLKDLISAAARAGSG